MADFCYDCTRDVLGMDPKHNDFTHLCGKEQCIRVLCEGCPPEVWQSKLHPGYVYVDHKGKRIDFTELARTYKGPDA